MEAFLMNLSVMFKGTPLLATSKAAELIFTPMEHIVVSGKDMAPLK